MPSSHRSPTTRTGTVVAAAALALALAGAPEPASASASVDFPGPGPSARISPWDATSANSPDSGWSWPLPGARRVLRGFEAPASRYSAGHRGIDVAASRGAVVSAPADGVVHFAGVVVDRPTITIATPEGVLISMEPVATELTAGSPVSKGTPLGLVSTGGHCATGCLHLGVRIGGDYVSPLRFFGGVPRAVLLPMH